MSEEATGDRDVAAYAARDDLLDLVKGKQVATPENLVGRTGLANLVFGVTEPSSAESITPGVAHVLYTIMEEVTAKARADAVARLAAPIGWNSDQRFQAAAAGELLGFSDDRDFMPILEQYCAAETGTEEQAQQLLRKIAKRLKGRPGVGTRKQRAAVWTSQSSRNLDRVYESYVLQFTNDLRSALALPEVKARISTAAATDAQRSTASFESPLSPAQHEGRRVSFDSRSIPESADRHRRGRPASPAARSTRKSRRLLARIAAVILASTLAVELLAQQIETGDPTSGGSTDAAGFAAKDGPLNVAVEGIRGVSNSWDAAFPVELIPASMAFTSISELPQTAPEMDEYFESELRSGAYVVTAGESTTWASLRLKIRNSSSRSASIRNLTVIDKKQTTVVDGLRVAIQGRVSIVAPISLHLDSANPEARVTVNQNELQGEPYFAKNAVAIPAGEVTSLSILLDAHKAAYSFALQLSYDVNGKPYVERVDNSGQPFRVTPALCDGSRRYGTRYVLEHSSEGQKHLTEVDPSYFISPC